MNRSLSFLNSFRSFLQHDLASCFSHQVEWTAIEDMNMFGSTKKRFQRLWSTGDRVVLRLRHIARHRTAAASANSHKGTADHGSTYLSLSSKGLARGAQHHCLEMSAAAM